MLDLTSDTQHKTDKSNDMSGALRNPNARFVLAHKVRKETCPSCGHKGTYRRYLDRHTGELLPETVGSCDRENNCGYYYSAKQWITDGGIVPDTETMHIPTPPPRRTDWRCPKDVYNRTQGLLPNGTHLATRNNLIHWMLGTYLGDSPLGVWEDYKVGTYPSGKNHPELTHAAVFWQIGLDGEPRSGKVIQYDPETGKRRKDVRANWIHSIVTKQSMEDIGCAQVYFGTHLLPLHPEKPVAIVESEKTALICSCLYPSHVWLATGGAQSLNVERSMCLAGRDVVIFPDSGMFEEWSVRALNIEPMLASCHVSDILEAIGAPPGDDIADFLLPENKFEALGIELLPSQLPSPVEPEQPVLVNYEPVPVWQDDQPPVVFPEPKIVVLESPLDRILNQPGVQALIQECDIDTSKLTIKQL